MEAATDTWLAGSGRAHSDSSEQKIPRICIFDANVLFVCGNEHL